MHFLEKIKEILKNNESYNVKIIIDSCGVKVFLIYDPADTGKENIVIPITYDVFEKYSYLDHEELKKMFHVEEYGLDLEDIKYIKEIMECLECCDNEITAISNGLSFLDRKNNDKSPD